MYQIEIEQRDLTLEQIQARRVLRTMKTCEFYAVRSEFGAQQGNREMSEADANFYASMVGVLPTERSALRERLITILGSEI